MPLLRISDKLCCYLVITFFHRFWWYSQSCAERPLHLIAYYQFSLCYLPNHYIVLPSWHLLKYFTKHPEDNNPHCDKCLAGWRALLFFHTIPSQIHAPMPHNCHSPLPLLFCFPSIVSKPPETPMHIICISYLSMKHIYFSGDETKTKEQTVTIKSAFSATQHLHKNFHSDLCVCL